MKKPVPPLIWPNIRITTIRAESIISTKLGVLNFPIN